MTEIHIEDDAIFLKAHWTTENFTCVIMHIDMCTNTIMSYYENEQNKTFVY